MFGEWFGGRPHENYHVLARVETDGSKLVLMFDEGEQLTVDTPALVTITSDLIRITYATRVLWTWREYGYKRRQYSIEYVLTDSGVTVQDNSDFCEPAHRPRRDAPAVELVSP